MATDRVSGNYVLRKDLIERTGIEAIDDVLYCLVNVWDIAMGRQLRSVYSIGSCAHGGYAPDSDIDLAIVWRDDHDSVDDPVRKLVSLMIHIGALTSRTLDPMYNDVEAFLYDAEHTDHGAGPVLRLALKKASRLLWGKDVRDRVELCSDRCMLDDVLAPSLIRMRNSRGIPEGTEITRPLADPRPDAEDRGFGDFHEVATRMAHIARALVFLKTGEFIFNKRQLPERYAEAVGGEWTGLVSDVLGARYGQVPEAEKRDVHVAACLRMTGFENSLLSAIG